MESMPNQRKREERQRAKRENRSDRKGRIFVVGFNGAFRGDDRTDAAHRRADRKQRRKFGLELEQPAEKGHERKRAGDFDGHKNETHSAQLQNVAQQKTRAEQQDPRLQPKFIGSDARSENLRNSDRVGNQEAENDSPQ